MPTYVEMARPTTQRERNKCFNRHMSELNKYCIYTNQSFYFRDNWHNKIFEFYKPRRLTFFERIFS